MGAEAPSSRPRRPTSWVSDTGRRPPAAARLDARHVGQDALQAADVERLGQVVAGAQAQRLDGALDVGVAGHQHHLGRGAELEVLEQVDAAAVREVEVDQGHVRACGG